MLKPSLLTAFVKSLAELDGFDLYTVHHLSSNENNLGMTEPGFEPRATGCYPLCYAAPRPNYSLALNNRALKVDCVSQMKISLTMTPNKYVGIVTIYLPIALNQAVTSSQLLDNSPSNDVQFVALQTARRWPTPRSGTS